MTLELLSEKARQNAHENLAYAGEVSPRDAYGHLALEQNAFLIDVRTKPEWEQGIPDLTDTGKNPLLIEWKKAPDYALNSNFVSELSKAVPDKNAALFFLCRSGGRSLDAALAMTQQGYRHCFNVPDGFEGSPATNQQYGRPTGWKAEKLPWRQG